MNLISKIFTALFIVFATPAFCAVQLPKLISDGMVLQRNAPVKVWGWAKAGVAVTVKFVDQEHTVVTDSSGHWEVILSKLKPGGPHTMTIFDGDTIRVNDILIGDVWLCSGQSNMETSMERVSPLYGPDIAAANNNFIRYFEVPKQYDFNAEHADLSGGKWLAVSQSTILKFSAVAYFYANELYKKYNIPIGLINSSLGGSPAEAWMSEEALKAFPDYYNEAQRFKNEALIEQIQVDDRARSNSWYANQSKLDRAYSDPAGPWYRPDMNTDDWATMTLPGYWADEPLGPVNGVVWFRKEIRVPEAMTGKPAKLNMGRVVDADSVFVNGVFVGNVTYQYPPRRYTIPAGVLKPGKNTITVRVINSSGRGGFVPDKPYEIVADDQHLDLKGDWQYKLGIEMAPLASQTFIRWKPLGLFNAMIAPLLNYRIKGVIWYQGESNVKNPKEYRQLFPAMIRNWREQWGFGNFPFLYVQLANFLETKNQPSESAWAMLREAQTQALSEPNTAMAVAIDIGEWNDIHPLNKKDVSKRLALAAQKLAYGDEQVVYSGPMFKSMISRGNTLELTFDHVGSGLVSRGGDNLKGFAIAGEDGKFVWAEAKIQNDRVFVWSDEVRKPVAVRYAWADNPEPLNFYNVEGLPAVPFRTDSWGE